MNAIPQVNIAGMKLYRRGKVRDVFEVGDRLLIVATDRISAFDVVMPNSIPHKGKVLTALSEFWFDYLKDTAANHLITTDINKFPAPLSEHRDQLEGRSMLVERADVFPVECVARGYLAGSGWKEYAETGEVCGVRLPEGLKESSRLPEPIFTPATKAETGHDINISEREMADRVGREATNELKELTLELYSKASDYASARGIIIADTKFEFGVKDGRVILVDEALTPDSSRFWPEDLYSPGRSQQSFDKQYVRDYLESLDWNKQPPGPHLPEEVVERTSGKYLEAYRLLTGRQLPDFVFRSVDSERSGAPSDPNSKI
ncbi:MAG TPA: phosphoribosylaminoimidazolesuccinocarboxamide synthase [Blastocatellia bacterium]|nr:phosphoribosylaminoimidazolesuccinocarboxamide synthase [Blastocatellia bacterium]